MDGRPGLLMCCAAIFCFIVLSAGTARASCTSFAPPSNSTVNCDGTNTTGVAADASTGVQLNLLTGGSIVPGSGYAISLGAGAVIDLAAGTTVGNGSIANTHSIFIGDGSTVTLAGTLAGWGGITGPVGIATGLAGFSNAHITLKEGATIQTGSAFSNYYAVNGRNGGNVYQIDGTIQSTESAIAVGNGDKLTIGATGRVTTTAGDTADAVSGFGRTGVTVTMDEGSAITVHGLGYGVYLGDAADVTVAGTITSLSDATTVNSGGGYGVSVGNGSTITVKSTGKILTGNDVPANGNAYSGNGGRSANGIFAGSNAAITVDGVVKSLRFNGIVAGVGSNITVGSDGLVSGGGSGRGILINAASTTANHQIDITVGGRVEALGTNNAIFISASNGVGSTDVSVVANVTVQAGATLYAANKEVYSQFDGAGSYPEVIDNLVVAGTIERGTPGRAIDLNDGADRLTLLPTFKIVGSIDGGSDPAGASEIDTFALDGAAGTHGTFDFGVNAITNFEAAEKIGAGKWTLLGNAGTGIGDHFAVKAGELDVDGDASQLSFGVASGATLGGAGTVGATTVESGGILKGVSGQALTLASLSLDNASILDLSLGAPSANALLKVNGALTLGGGVKVSDGGGFTYGTYRIADYGGALTDNGLTILSAPAGYNPGDWSIDTATSGQVSLVVAAGQGAQYWDRCHSSPGLVADGRGGSGTWNAANTNWTNQAGTINAAWSAQTAVFAPSADGGTVTIEGSQTIAGLRLLSGAQYSLATGTNGGLVAGAAQTTIDLQQSGGDLTSLDIAAPISGSGKLVKTGGGTLSLSTANTYAGGTSVEAGQLTVAKTGALGAGAVDVGGSGGKLLFDRADFTTVSAESLAITVASDGTLQFGRGGSGGTAAITNYGTVAFTASSDGGSAHIDNKSGALLAVSSTGEAGSATVTNAAGATVDISGVSDGTAAIGSLTGAGHVALGGNALVIGSLGLTGEISGVIADGGAAGGTGGSLRKVGDGMLTLSGANSFTGLTTVVGGTLRVDGSLAGGAQVATEGASAGTFGGDGTIAGLVTVANGGTLSGASGHTLTMGGLVLESGSTVDVTLGAPSNTRLYDVQGDLTLNGTLDVHDAGGFGAGVYRLMDYSGALTDNGLDIGLTPAGYSASELTVQTALAQQVNLVVATPSAPQIQFWNGVTLSPTGSITGGSGVWSASSATNWTSANGTTSDAWAGNFAVFQGVSPATSGVVTVDGGAGQVSVGGMQFIGSGWRLEGDSVRLNGTAGETTIRVGDGSEAGASDSAVISSSLIGESRLIKDDLGTLTLTGVNLYDGGTDIRAGTLALGTGGSILGDVVADGTFAFDRTDAFTFGGAISGGGMIRQIGSGKTILTGDSSAFSGMTSVESGTLAVNGTLGGDVAVLSGGRLQGTGTVGSLVVAAGGVHAPGNSIGTETVNGDYTNHGTLEIEVQPDAADKVVVGGNVDIAGATLTILSASSGAWPASMDFMIIDNRGTNLVIGSFANVVNTLAFLQPMVEYSGGDGNDVVLTLSRNAVSFPSVGLTSNQRAAAFGAESLGAGNSLYDAILPLDADTARFAFDQISGEIHPSVQGALIEESRYASGAAIDRVRQVFDAVAAPAMPTIVNGAAGAVLVSGAGLWGRGFGSWGSTDSDGNAASLDRSTGGFFAGGDVTIANDWVLGAVTGYSHSNYNIDARASSASSENYYAGLYGGTGIDRLGLRFGAIYGWHQIDTARLAAFPGFAERLNAAYDARSLQAFGEAGYRIDLIRTGFAQTAIEPFAGLAYVDLQTDGFSESGGSAALTGANATDATTFTTIGLRGSTDFALGGDVTAAVRGMLAWRHAFGDTIPLSSLAFSGGAPFTIAGAPIAEDALAVDLGLDLKPSKNVRIGLSYSGQIGDGSQDHGVWGNLSVDF